MIVSVCVVAYNEEKVLGKLLEDIQAQDYDLGKMEVVLIVSMSTDSTKEIMDRFQQQVTDFKNVQVLKNQEKAGFRMECCNQKFFRGCYDPCRCTCVYSA